MVVTFAKKFVSDERPLERKGNELSIRLVEGLGTDAEKLVKRGYFFDKKLYSFKNEIESAWKFAERAVDHFKPGEKSADVLTQAEDWRQKLVQYLSILHKRLEDEIRVLGLLFAMEHRVEVKTAGVEREIHARGQGPRDYSEVGVLILSNNEELRTMGLTDARSGQDIVYWNDKYQSFENVRYEWGEGPTIIYHGGLANPKSTSTHYMIITSPMHFDMARRSGIIVININMPANVYKFVSANNFAKLEEMLASILPRKWFEYLEKKEVRYGSGWREVRRTIFTSPREYREGIR